MRTYYCHPGRLEALNKRFREHTNRLFVKHGIELVGYWMPIDKPDILVYVLAYPSRDAADEVVGRFPRRCRMEHRPEGVRGRRAHRPEGRSVYMSPTDYSPIK